MIPHAMTDHVRRQQRERDLRQFAREARKPLPAFAVGLLIGTPVVALIGSMFA